jgi:hypothetical protein
MALKKLDPEKESSEALPSTLFFCPQSHAPDAAYLAGLYSFLHQSLHGAALLREAAGLVEIWATIAEAREEVRALSQGPVDLDKLRKWATDGECGALAAVRSGIVALPLLVLLQVGQYLRYLEFHNLAHHELLACIRDGNAGGAQGYCGGLPSAIAIACAKDEVELVEITGVMMRLLVGVGAFGEFAEDRDVHDSGSRASTTLALRLKYEGQADELVRRFPGVRIDFCYLFLPSLDIWKFTCVRRYF